MATERGWHFYNQGLTSAEAVKLLYGAIYDAAEESGAVLIGCNTIGHLGAGLMHVSRTGDDTSGFTWERTRRMGINSPAFRLPQPCRRIPADWQETDCLEIWSDGQSQIEYDWYKDAGADLESKSEKYYASIPIA